MKVIVNINGVDYEYNVTDKDFRKNKWLKSVDCEWCTKKDIEKKVK